MVGNLFFRGVKIHPQPMAGFVREKMAQAVRTVNIAEILSMSGQRPGLSCSFATEEMHLGKKVAWKWNNINDYLKYQYHTFHQGWWNHSNPAWRNSGGNWHAVNEQVMRDGLTAAFLQSPAARERLMKTGDKLLIANGKGPGDFFWGWQNGHGENKLGHILMDLRERLHPDKAVLFYERGNPYFEFTNFYGNEKIVFQNGRPHHYGYTKPLFYAPIGNVVAWPTSEHYFQARKFAHHPDLVQQIANLQTAGDVFRFARKNKQFMKAGWHQGESDQAMLDALRAKFKQNPQLRQKLLDTKGKELIENTATAQFDDPHWGIGRNGAGCNKLGKLLMHVREEGRTGQKMSFDWDWLREPWWGDEKQTAKIVEHASPPAYFSPNNLPKHHAVRQAPGPQIQYQNALPPVYFPSNNLPKHQAVRQLPEPQKIHYQNALPIYPAYNHPQTRNTHFTATHPLRSSHHKALPNLPGKKKKGLSKLWPDFLNLRKSTVAPDR